LKEIGLQPILNACVNCKRRKMSSEGRTKSDDFYFSSSANGLVCRDCEASFPDKVRLTSSAADVISDLKKLHSANEKILNEIEKVLIYHFTEILGRSPKMAKYVTRGS